MKHLTIVINQVLDNGIFLDKLKIANVVPIFKKGDRALTNTYRSISLLPVISKVIENIIYNQLPLYFESNTLLSYSQYGFRPNHSTEQATLALTHRILSAMDNNEVPIVISSIFQKLGPDCNTNFRNGFAALYNPYKVVLDDSLGHLDYKLDILSAILAAILGSHDRIAKPSSRMVLQPLIIHKKWY